MWVCYLNFVFFFLDPGQYGHGVAFTPISTANYTAPTTLAQFCDFPEYQINNGYHVCKLSVGQKGTIGALPFKWLTTNTTSSADLQSAGTVTFYNLSGTIADAVAVGQQFTFMDLSLEFKEPIDTTISLDADHPRGIREVDSTFPGDWKIRDHLETKDEKEAGEFTVISPREEFKETFNPLLADDQMSSSSRSGTGLRRVRFPTPRATEVFERKEQKSAFSSIQGKK